MEYYIPYFENSLNINFNEKKNFSIFRTSTMKR